MNRYQTQRIVRNHYNGSEREPPNNIMYEERQRAERQKIRNSFRVLTPVYQKPKPDQEEVAAMPMQVSGVRSIPYSKTLNNMHTLAEIRPYHPDNSRHRGRYQQRSSLKNLFIAQAYETWTHPLYGKDRIE